MTSKASAVKRGFPIGDRELRRMSRDMLLIELIVNIVCTAYFNRGPAGDSESANFAREWLESLPREEVWLLLLLLKGKVRSRKLRPGKVREVLFFSRVSLPVSLDAPECEDSDRTRLDTIAEQDDATCRTIREYDGTSLRRAIWDRAVEVGLSRDERQLLHTLLEKDWDIHDIVQEGFFVLRRRKDGELIRKKLSNEGIRSMYKGILRKLRCDELRAFHESFEGDV